MAKKSSAWLRKAYHSLAMNGRARTRCAQTACPSFRSLLLRSFTACPREHSFGRIFFRFTGYQYLLKKVSFYLLHLIINSSNENPVISGEAIKKKGEIAVKKYKLSERKRFFVLQAILHFFRLGGTDLIFFRFLFFIKRKKE